MRIFRVVLTGGPHAGKTETYKAIREYFINRDDILFFGVPETASELGDNNIKCKYLDKVFNYQDIIFRRQYSKEDTAYYAANHLLEEKDVLIVYDRGLIDNKAYLSSQCEFDKILNMYGQSEINCVDCYDLVIDLITTAGTEYGYHQLTNSSRVEDEHTAIPLDIKTSQAWLLHDNIVFVTPKEDINDKYKEVIGYIDDLISGKKLSYLETGVSDISPDFYKGFNDDNSKLIDITDYSLDLERSNGFRYHIIERKYKKAISYFLEISRREGNLKEIDTLDKISRETADIFINQLGIVDMSFKKKLNYYEKGEVKSFEFNGDSVTRIENVTFKPKVNNFVKKLNLC